MATLAAVAATADPADASSQTVKAQLRLRELIVGGELAAGERVPELALVERLGVSRTPVRAALHKLQDEGLLDALPGGGYAVRAFSTSEIHDAIEVRGTLEGLAVRLAAERGVTRAQLAPARECLVAIDAVLAPARLPAHALATYGEHNARFHMLLADMAGSAVVRRQVERAAAMPFAAPSGFVLAGDTAAPARDMLVAAQRQHHAVLDAVENREGTRAESLMREHARTARHNLAEVLANRQALRRLPGAALIR